MFRQVNIVGFFKINMFVTFFGSMGQHRLFLTHVSFLAAV